MAVMTSPALDKVPLEVKGASLPSVGAMALDAKANGVHDVLFDEPAPQPAPQPAESQQPPTMNGNHPSLDASAPALEPATNVSSGIEPVADFLPDQADPPLLLNPDELEPTSVANAVEAPTSDIREEVVPNSSASLPPTQASIESTQQVLETQLNTTDTMDISLPALDAETSPRTDGPPTHSMTELSLQNEQAAAPSHSDINMEDAPASGRVRSREEDDEFDAPDAKRTKTEEDMSNQTEFKVPEVPAHTEQTNGNDIVPPVTAADQTTIQPAATAEEWPTTPMTQPQVKFLLERVRNTKKIKVSHAFREPVDIAALNIPQYPDFVKNPMDLSTMETKLKEGKYTQIVDFMADLDQIIDNSVIFNGKEHPVTQAGYNMRAYFLKGMTKMPRSGVEEPPKQKQPKKPAVPTTTKPRRESRAAANTVKSPTGPAPTAASPQTPWPLNADGMPLIRRDSSSANDRPKREIHRPPPKDLPYNTVKPKKKKYQQELRFCESVMSELLKPKYQKFSWPFLKPVDPVALNIPTYLKIIKKPMDFGTIEKNLKEGQYQTAKDFYNDAQLVFANCYKFNPENDEVHRMGKQLQEQFNTLWDEKADWLAAHAPTSDAQSHGSADSDEEQEEEEEEEVDQTQDQILAIQKQIQALNETAQALLQQKSAKRTSPKVTAKKKGGKAPAPKKKNSLSVPPPLKTAKPKARTKAPAPLSFAQKQEISDGISTLGDSDMRKAVQIIRNGCPHLANVNDDEMEIDMDEIGDDTLRELFKFIKQVRAPKATVDDDFEPPRPSHRTSTQKPKKNKPMGKKEQEDNIKRIQEQLRNFENSASASSQSPPAHQDESSDDESSGSESEEE
ncbi:Bromodomain-containing protein [Lojkania enalia]|uniref:Bromodomain-containing protein n=1 Tax=Lojkania enalia TaxID=147567 RepID=A0A9P4KG17_9PLEO|nr:Bromodomain-containing protein [Didymosphaeria enalia]